jgi:hypothetical protein
MKNLIAMLAACCLGFTAHAQLEKGTHIAGLQATLIAGDMYSSDLAFSSSSSEFHYGFALVPTYGYTLLHNWVIGGTVTFGFSKDTYSYTVNTVFRTSDLGFAPFTRIYLDLGKNGRFKAFALGSLEFITIKENAEFPAPEHNSYSHTNAAVGFGVAYFGKKIAFDINVSGAGLRFGAYKTFGRAKK